jgi:L-fucose mutarotase
MLKHVPALLTPDLLRSLAEMGHGDRLAIVDRNYPSATSAPRVHLLPGADTAAAARAILELFPVDDVDAPAVFRIAPTGQLDAHFDAHDAELRRAEGRDVDVRPVERREFYELARSVYAIVQTGEARGYSCFVLTKGVLPA